jgi:hypothetical protein
VEIPDIARSKLSHSDCEQHGVVSANSIGKASIWLAADESFARFSGVDLNQPEHTGAPGAGQDCGGVAE